MELIELRQLSTSKRAIPVYFETLSEMLTCYIVITAQVQSENANKRPVLVQKMNWRQYDPVLDQPNSVPVTVLVQSLGRMQAYLMQMK